MALVWVYDDGSEFQEVTPGSLMLGGSLRLVFRGDDVYELTNNPYVCGNCEACDADV